MFAHLNDAWPGLFAGNFGRPMALAALGHTLAFAGVFPRSDLLSLGDLFRLRESWRSGSSSRRHRGHHGFCLGLVLRSGAGLEIIKILANGVALEHLWGHQLPMDRSRIVPQEKSVGTIHPDGVIERVRARILLHDHALLGATDQHGGEGEGENGQEAHKEVFQKLEKPF